MNDILLIIIGSVIGFIASVGILVVERILDRAGKLKIYFKFVSLRDDGRPWGVYEESGLLALFIPVKLEIQNTTNTTKVIRDLSIELYHGTQYVCKMVQINRFCKSERIKTTTEPQYGNNGSYSFVIKPRSINNEECLYSYHINESDVADFDFNVIKISYYDEKDKKVIYEAKNRITGWDLKRNQVDHDWLLLK